MIANLLIIGAMFGTALAFAIVGVIVAYNLSEAYKLEDY